MDPYRVLAPGDPVSKLVERALIQARDTERTDELVALARTGGVIAGQVVALSLGADPKSVMKISELLLGGDDE
jgi:hypothetical protein